MNGQWLSAVPDSIGAETTFRNGQPSSTNDLPASTNAIEGNNIGP
jgi:hypothetical protein